MGWWSRLKDRVAGLKSEIRTLYLAYRHPAVPMYAKIWLICVVAYALSPIDLIPDFIPVLGYVDDLILLPLGIWLAVKMIPPDVLTECRAKAAEPAQYRGAMRWVMASLIVLLWIALASLGGWLAWWVWIAS